MLQRKNDESKILNSRLQAKIEKKFLTEFLQHFKNQDTLSMAVYDRESITMNNNKMGLTNFDQAHPFTTSGELEENLAERLNYKLDVNRITESTLRHQGLNCVDGSLSLRERLIFEAVISVTTNSIDELFRDQTTMLFKKTSIICEKMVTAKKEDKQILDQESDAINEQIQNIRRIQFESIKLTLNKIKPVRLVDPLAYQMDPDMEASIRSIISDNIWNSYFLMIMSIEKANQTLSAPRNVFNIASNQNEINLLNDNISFINSKDIPSSKKIIGAAMVLTEIFYKEIGKTSLLRGKIYKSFAELIDKINENPDDNHFIRMVGLILKSMYDEPSLNTDWQDPQLRVALDRLQIPKDSKINQVYQGLLTQEGLEENNNNSNNNNNNNSKPLQHRLNF